MGQTKNIGVLIKNIYKLKVDGYTAMVGKAEEVVSRDEGKLWHRRLGHLHHGTLKILQQISTDFPRVLLHNKISAKDVLWVSF